MMRDIKTVAIVLLVLLVVFLCERLVYVENQRYALFVGLCPHELILTAGDIECLRNVQTRTSWVWHLYYAFIND